MNQEALEKTQSSGRSLFLAEANKDFGPKRGKREFLKLVSVKVDCDQDTLLITASPEGPHVTKEPVPVGGKTMHPV